MRGNFPAVVAAALTMVTLATDCAANARTEVTRIDGVQSVYLQHCGGCHGVQGASVPREIPELRGQVGNFLCTAEGRAYLVRLPNVALAPVSDEVLAAIMNFVVFTLGEPAPDVSPYTVAEVSQLRKQPLTGTGLAEYRARIVSDLIDRCGAPGSLRMYSVDKVR